MRVPGHTAITLVLLAVAAGGCTDKPSAAQGATPSPQVTVTKPTKRLIAETDEYVGRFVAVDSVEVRARVAGYLATVHFRDGQFVKEGDLLFTIDRRPFEATLAQAQASLAQAKANLAFTTSDLERAQRLVGGAVITQQTFDQRTQAMRVAEANVAAQEAAVRQTQLDHEFAELRAPVSGRIGDRRVTPGNLVTGGTNGNTTLLTTITSIDPIRFEFTFDEASYLRYVRANQRGAASFPGDMAAPVRLKLIDEEQFTREGKMDFALLLKPHVVHHSLPWWQRPLRAFFQAFNRGFEALGSGYGWLTARVVRLALIMLVVYAGVIGFGLNEFRRTPVGFIPQLDAGYLIAITQLPGGASLARTDAVNRKVVDVALQVPGVAHAVNIVGFSGATFTNAPNSGAVFLILEPFESRGRDPHKSAAAIQGALFQKLGGLQEGLVLVVMPPSVRGIGNAGGFRMMIEDRAGAGPQALQSAVYAMMGRAAQTPGVLQVFSIFETSTPQLYLDIDRTKLQMLRLNISDVFGALQTYLGSSYVNDFNLLDRTFRVTAQADSEYRRKPKDVLSIRVRNANGDTVPLGSFATVRDTSGSYRVPRYNLFPTAELDGAAAPGFSQGQAIEIMEKLAANALPSGFSYEWTTLALQQLRAGSTAILSFMLAVVFVFLVLAAQYESLTSPLAVILIVPMCLIASITGVLLRGMDNNILTQVGFIVLIGLAAKNAILIVEFAKQLEDQGQSRLEAAVEAARLRLRPILMTSLAFIFGVVPLVWAIGAGAELRQTLGTAVFAGMIGVTAFGLIFTPVFYVVCRWFSGLVSETHVTPASSRSLQQG